MANKSISAIFTSDSDESSVATIRRSMKVELDDNGDPVVSFAMNRGKGSGTQVIPVDQFEEYVSTLAGYAEDGIGDTPEQQLSASESVRQTIHMDEDVISFRVRSGKGAKPARVALSEFSDVVNLLQQTLPRVQAAGRKLLGE